MPVPGLRRRRFTPLALAAGLVSSAVLGLGTTGTFSALTATVQNTLNSAGTGTLVMQETDANGTQTGSCISTNGTGDAITCTAFNKYGGSTALRPGSGTSTAAVRIYSTGSFAPGSFTLTPQTCGLVGGGTPATICGYLDVTLTCTVTSNGTAGTPVQVYDGTLANANLTKIAQTGAVDLKTAKACLPPQTVPGGTSFTTFNFSVALDSTAPNSVQGQTAQQELDWQFQS